MRKSFFGRHSIAILMLFALLLPSVFAGTRRALWSNTNDVKSWLPAAYKETTTFNWYWEHFESDAFILVSWEGCTLDDPRLPLLARKLAPPVGQGGGKAGQEYFTNAVTGAQLLRDLVDEQEVPHRAALGRLQGSLIGPDGRQTCLLLTISRQAMQASQPGVAVGRQPQKKFLHAAVERIYSVAEEECAIPRAEIHMGGPPVDNVAIDVEGERSLYRLAGFCAIAGLLLSWWCLRSWSFTIMVFSASLISAGISLAIVWYSGSKMNAILLTMPSLVYVAATSGAIHLINYYRDTSRQLGVEGAPGRAVAKAWLPLALATGTTAIGLASLSISELVPIKMFGIYSAIGVVVSFVVLCTYLPALLQIWPPKPGLESQAGSLPDPGLSPRWRGVGEFVIRRQGWVTVACLLLMGFGAYGATRVQTSVKLMRLFAPEAQIIQDYAWLEEHLGPLVPMEIVIRVDRQKCRLDLLSQMQLVGKVQQAVANMPEVGSALAATTFTRPIPTRAGLLTRSAWNVVLEKNRDQLRDYLCTDKDEQLWRISARVPALTDLDYGPFVQEIRKVVEPILHSSADRGIDGVSAEYTGLVPLIYKAQHSMLDGLLLGFVGDLILIIIAIVVLMRNWSAGLLLAIPSLFPLAIVFGAMGWLGIVVDTGTVMTPAVALGVTVDDAIHFMLWCRHGQERGMDRQRAIMFAYEDCARAIYQSWGVIGLGLFAFALSSFMPTRRFGYLMLTMLTVSSIGNLVLLPALLAGPAGQFFWRLRRPRTPAQPPHAVEGREPTVHEPLIPTNRRPAAGAGPHLPAAPDPNLAGNGTGRPPVTGRCPQNT